MKINSKLSAFVMVAALLGSSVALTGCNDNNDEFGTEQYVGGVSLNVFGPSPVARGGELRFLGSGMNQITSIEIPGCSPITDIKVVSDNEIRITVPQEAETGQLTLNFAKGSIITKTKLTYLEPISIESFSPAKVKAGDKLTIKGEYLNLIKEVIFCDGVAVPEDEFVSHSRSEIQVIVPLEAQTGKFIVSDGAEELPNWIYSDEDLEVVLPTVAAPLDLTDAKGGDTVTIEGSDLDLVTDVQMPNGDSVEFTYADGKITFVLPDNITDGAIVAVAPSGVKVAIANVGVVMPVIEKFTPSEGLRGGDVVTITGVNMDQVESVVFANVSDPVKPSEVTATTVKVSFPAMAHSGEITLNLKSGKTNSEITLQTAKPEVMAFEPNPVAAAAEFTMTGKNLDLITKVTFGGDITVDVTPAAADKLTLTAPATAQSGKLTLTMANGETVETSQLDIDSPQCAFITETVSEELLGGQLMVVKINNGDVLTDVLVNGTSVQYINNDGTLYIALPQSAGKGTVITLVSSNGEISYTYDVTPATHIETVIWSGAWECAGWAGNQDLAWGGFDWSTVPAGAKMSIYLTSTVPAGQWWCISLRHGQDWGFIPGLLQQYDTPESPLEIVLTQDVLNDLIANGGLVITGQDYVLSKITISYELSMETEVMFAEMPIVLSSWENHEVGPGNAFLSAGIQVGQTLRIYCDITGDDPCIQIFDGHWNAWTWPEIGGTQQFNSSNSDMSCLVLKVTEDVYYRASTFTDWGYNIIFQGQACTVTKITLE